VVTALQHSRTPTLPHSRTPLILQLTSPPSFPLCVLAPLREPSEFLRARCDLCVSKQRLSAFA
jgi:hypothetical protein